MAARVDMKVISLSRAEIEAYLVLILALDALCRHNLDSLQKVSHTNKQFDKLKEYNDLIFVMEIMAELHEEMVSRNIFQYFKENQEQEIAFQEKILFAKMKEFQDANNFRMYNETRLALQKLMQEDYTKVLSDLNRLKNNFTLKLAEFDNKIKRLDNSVLDMGSKAQNSFHQVISNLIDNSPEHNQFQINDIVIDYDPKEIWQKLNEAYKGRFVEEGITNADDINERLEIIINDYVREKIKNHSENKSFTPDGIKAAVTEATSNFKRQFDADPTATEFYKFLARKKDYVEERQIQVGLRKEVEDNLEKIEQQIESVTSAQGKALNENSTDEDLKEYSAKLEEAGKFANEITAAMFKDEIAEGVDAEEKQKFIVDEDEENFELDASANISIVAPEQKLSFEIDDNEEEFAIEESPPISAPIEASSQPISENKEEPHQFKDEPRLSPGGVPISQINQPEDDNPVSEKSANAFDPSQIQKLLLGKKAASVLSKAQENQNNPQVAKSGSPTVESNNSSVNPQQKKDENQKAEDENKDDFKPRGPKR